MTYFGFLGFFVCIPIIVLAGLLWFERRRGLILPDKLTNWPAGRVLFLHMFIALVYTTPWDNYLVATRVWWYDPALVTGIVLGWVPLEEYTFFVLQPLLTGLWLLFIARCLPSASFTRHDALNNPTPGQFRQMTTSLAGLLWLLALIILISQWKPGTYLALGLIWALPPITFQLAFGADILWRYRWLIGLTLISATLYLSLADALAISSGTWTIDPAQSLNIYLGVLPLEEFLFFLLTNTVLVFGMILFLARESQERLHTIRNLET